MSRESDQRRATVRGSARTLRCALGGAIALALGTAAPALASEGGGSVYPYGLNTVATGILPRPGNYLYNYNTLYSADVTTTNAGQPAPVPFDVEVRAHTLRWLHVFDGPTVLGGTPGLLVAQPYVVGDARIGTRSEYRSGLGDTTVGAMLGWHGPKLHRLTGVDVTLPTGAYSTAHLFNPGRNQWAATFYYAVTAPLGQRFDANVRANFTVNARNPDTRYSTAPEAGVEYSLNVRLGRGWLAGVNGYYERQLGDDESGGVDIAAKRLRVFAYGPQVIWRGQRYGASAKWQHEDGARNKAQGDKYWLQFFYAFGAPSPARAADAATLPARAASPTVASR